MILQGGPEYHICLKRPGWFNAIWGSGTSRLVVLFKYAGIRDLSGYFEVYRIIPQMVIKRAKKRTEMTKLAIIMRIQIMEMPSYYNEWKFRNSESKNIQGEFEL